MLQKELAKRLKARYDTKMDGNEWMEVSSDGIPLCRIKYNGQYLSNADQNLSDEYCSKIADIQDEISTVREWRRKINDQSLNRKQIAFVHKIINRIEQNGYMENVTELQNPPFDKPVSFVKLFDARTRAALLAAINKVKENAVVIAA